MALSIVAPPVGTALGVAWYGAQGNLLGALLSGLPLAGGLGLGSVGRFLQNEPLLSRKHFTQYLYAGQNPVDRADPLGLACCCIWNSSSIAARAARVARLWPKATASC